MRKDGVTGSLQSLLNSPEILQEPGEQRPRHFEYYDIDIRKFAGITYLGKSLKKIRILVEYNTIAETCSMRGDAFIYLGETSGAKHFKLIHLDYLDQFLTFAKKPIEIFNYHKFFTWEQGIEAHYDKETFDYYASLHDYIIKQIIALLKQNGEQGFNIIDLGCGDGRFLQEAAKITGL